jgi:hypothetical protein
MLHSILVALTLLASPTMCCGGGGFGFLCCRPAPQPVFVAPPISIAPPKVELLKFIRIDQYPAPVRVGLAIIAPRPFGHLLMNTLQADTQSK